MVNKHTPTYCNQLIGSCVRARSVWSKRFNNEAVFTCLLHCIHLIRFVLLSHYLHQTLVFVFYHHLIEWRKMNKQTRRETESVASGGIALLSSLLLFENTWNASMFAFFPLHLTFYNVLRQHIFLDYFVLCSLPVCSWWSFSPFPVTKYKNSLYLSTWCVSAQPCFSVIQTKTSSQVSVTVTGTKLKWIQQLKYSEHCKLKCFFFLRFICSFNSHGHFTQ